MKWPCNCLNRGMNRLACDHRSAKAGLEADGPPSIAVLAPNHSQDASSTPGRTASGSTDRPASNDPANSVVVVEKSPWLPSDPLNVRLQPNGYRADSVL